MLHPGDQLHHYIVEVEVGGGGMSRVYRVRHGILGHSLALKVLDPYWVKQPNVRKRFLAEGQIQALVRHPAIVAVTDAVVDAKRGIAGLVMEYVEGPTLAQFIERSGEPPPAELVRDLITPVLQGMHHAHEEGVIHRDLKPRNVLLSRDAAGRWYPRIVDFGVAYVREEAESRLTIRRPERAAGLLGTPAFMSPEQAEGRGSPTPRWDVFSLGIILYELATGVHPFEKEDEEATLRAIIKGDYLPPEQVHPKIDPSLASAIRGALAVDPAKRFQDCAAFAAALSGEVDLGELAEDSQVMAALTDPAAPRDLLPEALLVLPDVPSREQEWAVVGLKTLVGTGPDAHIKLPPSGGVEPVHFAIQNLGGMWMLEDLSASGTRVNGARVKRIQLDNGDLIRVGHTVLRFKSHADAIQDEPALLDESVTEVAPTHDAWIEHRDDEGRSRRIPVTPAGVLIGRDADVDLLIQDIGVSRRHCKLMMQGLDVTIEDLGSANGTFVDGQKVRFRRLKSGDTIQVGSTRVKFFRRR